VLPETCGRLVPPGEVAPLAAALDELLADAEERRRLGEAGRAEAARYAWPHVAGQVLAVYERVARPRDDAAARKRQTTRVRTQKEA
jgi:glycosyltransferase involved in cell wall biosynthesis